MEEAEEQGGRGVIDKMISSLASLAHMQAAHMVLLVTLWALPMAEATAPGPTPGPTHAAAAAAAVVTAAATALNLTTWNINGMHPEPEKDEFGVRTSRWSHWGRTGELVHHIKKLNWALVAVQETRALDDEQLALHQTLQRVGLSYRGTGATIVTSRAGKETAVWGCGVVWDHAKVKVTKVRTLWRSRVLRATVNFVGASPDQEMLVAFVYMPDAGQPNCHEDIAAIWHLISRLQPDMVVGDTNSDKDRYTQTGDNSLREFLDI